MVAERAQSLAVQQQMQDAAAQMLVERDMQMQTEMLMQIAAAKSIGGSLTAMDVEDIPSKAFREMLQGSKSSI